ncbi:Calcineurin-like phosphoesterase [Desulfomicrobium norvegicum]|uniref:Calcineurin-like phosphoesterase n=1 Tax=Desulfomicrobium norvegicum (strain DSM 1741 / NCIMB 8310) TaxID=52561 RepID=A0A8G2C3W8_DESNO|nr:metallophosphoesterase [Desulfomicrobium norvegicum]SFL87538.1 Calcineurin-like phosphoesterase [Desulfomicrobium norvegicum]
MKTSYKRYILWALAGLYVIVAGMQIYAGVVTYTARQTQRPPNLGNFESVRAALPASDAKKTFTFVIVGDTRSTGTFKGLSEDIKDADPDFIVILGDWVNGGSMNHHTYFKWKLSDYNFSFPVFLTPGNHDVDPEKYPMSLFEKEYGPSNFSFVYNNNIFIFISHLDSRFSNKESLKYLQSLDKSTLDTYQNRFVFMHIPPWVSPDIKERHIADEKDLMQIFEDLKIDYAVAADFHGYNRTRLREVEYIITGGGGGRLHESQGSQFHHAIALTVGTDMVSERILPVSARFDFKEWIDMNSIVYIGPFLILHYKFLVTLNILLIISLVFSLKLIKNTD